MKQNVIRDKCFGFSLEIIELYKIIISKNEYVLSKQLLRSATSIGANICEAISAESKNDFLHKMSISLKEARETKYWLELLQTSQLVKYNYKQNLINIEEIIKF